MPEKLPKINHAFEGMTDVKFIDRAEQVVKGLTDNEFFPDIAPYFASFVQIYHTFLYSMPTHSTRSTANSAIKNANKEVVTRALMKLSYMVAFMADFNEAALISSGFELMKKRERKGCVGLVEELEVYTNGERGVLIVQCKKDSEATIYKVRVSTDEENWIWTNARNTRTVKVYGIPVDTQVYVQMQIGNSKGDCNWSKSKKGMIGGGNFLKSIHK